MNLAKSADLQFFMGEGGILSSKVLTYIKERPKRAQPGYWTGQQISEHIIEHEKPWAGLVKDKKLVAFILYNHFDDIIEISYLESNPSFLRKGYMEKLIRKMLTQYSGATIWLDVHHNNRPAINLYRKVGFLKTGQRKGYYRDGGDSWQFNFSPSLSL